MSARAIGDMRRRLVIEAPIETVDDNGGASRVYVSAGEIWAHVMPLRMTHGFAAACEEQVVTHHVTFRFRNGVDVAMRFRDGQRIFYIRAVEDVDERRTHLRALCEEIKA